MPSLPSTPSRVPPGHETKFSISYLHSPTVRPKDIVRLSGDPLIQDSLSSRHTKSYPKRKLLPEFDDEALEPIQLKNKTADQPDRPPRGRDREANDVAHKSAHDLRKDLHQKAGMTRSIYGSRKRAPAQNHGRPNGYTDRITALN